MDQPNADVSGQPTARPEPATGTRGVARDATATLQRELDKWRERVPPLLAALRERSDEVERLQSELAALRGGRTWPPQNASRPGMSSLSEGGGAALALEGVRAREMVIAELERELESARTAHVAAQGELHARALSIDVLKRDLQVWKTKWQDLARKLDGLAFPDGAEDGRIAELTAANGRLTQELAAARRSFAELTEERNALQARNADLFETTGYANRQMEVLADDLAELRGQLKALRVEREAIAAERDGLGRERTGLEALLTAERAELEALEAYLATLQAPARAASADSAADLSAATDRIAELEAANVALAERLEAERSALAADLGRAVARGRELEAALGAAVDARESAERARADAERRRAQVEVACAAAEAACAAADQARGSAEEGRIRAEAELQSALEAMARAGQQAGGQTARLQQLEHQLGERSALVRSLEQELIERDQRLARSEVVRLELEEAQVRANRHARENADYIQQLDGRLERQKELLGSLESELAAAQEGLAQSSRQHETEIAARDGEIRALQLQIAALQSMLQERPASDAPVAPVSGAGPTVDSAEADPVRVERDSRTLRILNQQLKDARTRNDTLLERIRELETHALVAGESASDDDLTRIRGVGPRLAQHLRELGVRSYQQIAELDPESLEDPSHALAPLKSRILRDRWIEQAASLFRH